MKADEMLKFSRKFHEEEKKKIVKLDIILRMNTLPPLSKKIAYFVANILYFL